MTSTVYISVTDTAKIIRRVLAFSFPGVKFSVRSDRYAGGASIDITYTDGPTERQVKRAVQHFQGATFDGMIDLKSSLYAEWQGKRTHFGADYIFPKRQLSVPFLSWCVAVAAERWGFEPPDVIASDYGAYIDPKQDRPIPNANNDYITWHVNAVANRTDARTYQEIED